MEQYLRYARDTGAAAGSGVAPLGQEVQFNVIEWWPYAFHPSTNGSGDNFGVLFNFIKNRQSSR